MNVKYTDNNGNEVELTTEIVKKYMVSGCAEKVTDQEIATFIKTCEYGKLGTSRHRSCLQRTGS